MEALGTEDVSQRGLCQQPCRVVRVLDVGHGDGRVRHTVVDDGIHRHRHGVSCQYLQWQKLLGTVVVSCDVDVTPD